MSWIALDPATLGTRLAGPELDAVRAMALAAGQPDPVPETALAVVELVRGYVAANTANTLGPAGTLPARLEDAALAILRNRLLNRFPIAELNTEPRQAELRDAMSLLKDVAVGRFRISTPEATAPATDAAPAPTPKWSARPRRFPS